MSKDNRVELTISKVNVSGKWVEFWFEEEGEYKDVLDDNFMPTGEKEETWSRSCKNYMLERAAIKAGLNYTYPTDCIGMVSVWGNGEIVAIKRPEVTIDSGADVKLYIVERWGVYQQGIVGVFDSLNLAEEAKNKASSNECDDYHLFEIRELTLNEMQELFSIKKDYRDHTSFQKYDYK